MRYAVEALGTLLVVPEAHYLAVRATLEAEGADYVVVTDGGAGEAVVSPVLAQRIEGGAAPVLIGGCRLG